MMGPWTSPIRSRPAPNTRAVDPRRGMSSCWRPIAAVTGLGIGWLDSRPGNDATGVTVVLLLSAAFAFAAASGRRRWLWAILVGVWVPLFELGGSSGPASLAALVVSIIGAAAGYLLARFIA